MWQYESSIELFLDGYRPFREHVLFAPGETYHIRHVMEPLAAGEAAPQRPTPSTVPPIPGPPAIYDAFGRPDRNPDSDRASSQPGGGALAIRVQPADAVVIVDGEQWQASASRDRLEIRLSPGTHRVEVQKDGYVPFTTTVTVTAGETSVVNISLTRGGN